MVYSNISPEMWLVFVASIVMAFGLGVILANSWHSSTEMIKKADDREKYTYAKAYKLIKEAAKLMLSGNYKIYIDEHRAFMVLANYLKEVGEIQNIDKEETFYGAINRAAYDVLNSFVKDCN